MKWWKLGFVVIGASTCLMPLGCSMNADTSAESQQYGSLRMPLVVESNGFVYELQNAVFTVIASDAAAGDMQSYPAAPGQTLFELSLPGGNYLLQLEAGWELVRTDPGTGLVETLPEASLVSENPVDVQINSQSVTQVLFSFSVDGTIIDFSNGMLQVGLEVCDSTGCVSNLGPSGTGGYASTGGSTGAGGSATGTGGSSSGFGVPSNFAFDGYGDNGMWRGYLFTVADPTSNVYPDCSGGQCFIGAGPEVCVSGVVAPSPNYDSYAIVGWNLAQTPDGSPPMAVPAVGSGVFVHLESPLNQLLRVQVQDPSGTTYCADYPGGPAVIPWQQFNTQCWDNTGLPLTPGQPIQQLQFIVPSRGDVPAPFEFCVVDVQPM